MKRVAIADDTSRLANIDLNYWFYGCSALASISGIANLRGVVHADDDALEHALHARYSHELNKNPGRCGLRAAQGSHGLDHIQQPQGHRGRQ
ncbi:hypothetical protein [Collinsella aerofaciens]|uniref:hypothetical protein n=1 Tax=Collinsella aerofaciens TaxID=74426 RepID=UPI0034A32716